MTYNTIAGSIIINTKNKQSHKNNHKAIKKYEHLLTIKLEYKFSSSHTFGISEAHK